MKTLLSPQPTEAGNHALGTGVDSNSPERSTPAAPALSNDSFARDVLFFTANDALLLALDFIAAGDADNARLQIESARTALGNLRALDSHNRPQIININA